MHYGRQAFSINGKDTIVALQGFSGVMGQRRGMSDKDIERINKMYKCIDVSGFRENPVEEREIKDVGFNARMLYAIKTLISNVLGSSDTFRKKLRNKM